MNNPEQDLDWLAFCYAAGELDGTQSAAFEELLATSQDARERVAAMVALTQQIAESCTVRSGCVRPAAVQPRTKNSHGTGERLLWLASGLAVLVFALSFASNPPPDKSPGSSSQVQLASAWAEALADSNGITDSASEAAPTELPSEEVGSGGVASASTSEQATDAEDGVEVPEWMIAALGGEEATDPADDEPEMGDDWMSDELLDELMFQEG